MNKNKAGIQTRKIIHIDMDCFYAAIEMRDNPELRVRPIAVGGSADKRGVISTCNYVARQYGVHSAMSSKQALKLCPHLVILPVRMQDYKKESQMIQAIFADYSDCIEPLSLDEAYIDVSESDTHRGSATLIACEIRERILSERQLTASAGVAPNKSLAKIASDWNKPNGQKVIRPEDVEEFMQHLPVGKLFGVGQVTEQKIHKLGAKTCGELQTFNQDQLQAYFGNFGLKLYDLCRGYDNRPVEPSRNRKSLSVEETFLQDISNLNQCLEHLPQLMKTLKERLQRIGKEEHIQKCFVKLKFSDFSQTTVERVTHELQISTYQKLLSEGWSRKALPVRLIGLGIRLLEGEDADFQSQLALPGFD